ncbi:MAG: inorganic diphosphatase [Fibrobacteres bacterium]|nr:inorganic diphosphatase [Fibrobacterota bacterium]
MNYLTLPIGSKYPHVVRAVIEISKDTNTKFEYDESLNIFVLDRVLLSSMLYPANYGFIPSTRADDGDCLDILVLMNAPMPPGTVVDAIPVGVLDMTDGGVKDYKVLAVPAFTLHPPSDIDGIDPIFLMIARNFFKGYKELEGKIVEIGPWLPRAKALEYIQEGHELFNRLLELEP